MELEAREGSPVSQGRWILRRVTLTLHHGSHLAAASARVSPAPLVGKWGAGPGAKKEGSRGRRGTDDAGHSGRGLARPARRRGAWGGGGEPGTRREEEEEQEEEPGQARSVQGFREAAAG